MVGIPEQVKHQKYVDEFIIGDIDDIIPALPQCNYDVVLCADVLEHLVNPWATLSNLRNCLKTNGRVIASIPNICNLEAIIKIVLHRDFSYEEQGIFDRTHLRFFCKRNIVQLFTSAGFRVLALKSTVDGRNRMKWLANMATFGIFYEYLAKQYFVEAKMLPKPHN